MRYHKQTAFTLIEILVVLAILALLVGIGYPNYIEYLKKGYRAEARQNIVAIVQAEEQFYLENNAYFFDNTDDNAALAAASGGLWQAEGDDDGQINYTYTVVPDGGGYTVTATGNSGTPVAGETIDETH